MAAQSLSGNAAAAAADGAPTEASAVTTFDGDEAFARRLQAQELQRSMGVFSYIYGNVDDNMVQRAVSAETAAYRQRARSRSSSRGSEGGEGGHIRGQSLDNGRLLTLVPSQGAEASTSVSAAAGAAGPSAAVPARAAEAAASAVPAEVPLDGANNNGRVVPPDAILYTPGGARFDQPLEPVILAAQDGNRIANLERNIANMDPVEQRLARFILDVHQQQQREQLEARHQVDQRLEARVRTLEEGAQQNVPNAK